MNTKPPYFLILMAILLAYVVFLIVQPFLTAILSSFILTFIFHKMFKLFNKKIKNKSLCSFVTLIIILLIIIIPSIFIINSLAQESLNIYHTLKGKDFTPLISKYLDPAAISSFINAEQIQEYINQGINKFLLIIIEFTSDFILALPVIVLFSFITIFLTYYLLKESDFLLAYIDRHIPLKPEKRELLFEKLRITANALIFGTILAALLQGLLGGIAFAVFNVKSPFLWGLVMSITSVIPILGTSIVWFPISILKLIQGDLVSGIGLFLVGSLMISTIDNIIRPKFISKRANVHPALVLIGILGGINLFGLIGILVGPLILTLAVELIKLKGEFNAVKS